MPSDDQQFIDLLASVPQDVARYSSRIADYIEKHTDALATNVRDAIEHASWVPESMKPTRFNGANSAHFFSKPPPPPQTLYEKTVAFISNNRTTIAIVIAFAGTTVYMVQRKKKEHSRKRRAKKLPNGAKKELVVLACSTFHDPLTKSLAVDLERRGYVVYVTVSSTEEDSLVQQEAKADLRPLWVDLTSTVPSPATDTHPNLEPIRELLTKSSGPTSPDFHRKQSAGSAMSNMTFAGIIVFPGCSGYPADTFTNLHPSDLVDSINTRLVSLVLTTQQFYPLLQRYSTDYKSPSSIVVAYPSIPQSLSPPTQILETIITSGLKSFAASLRRDIQNSRSNLTVTELKLGNFDLGSVTSKSLPRSTVYNNNNHRTHEPSADSSTSSSQLTLTHTHWHSSQRAAIQRSSLGQLSLIKGSAAREFHNAVFDALAPPQTFRPFRKYEWTSRKRHETHFVGQGARLYSMIGRVLPDGLVGWMMGYRRAAHAFSSPTGSSSLASSQNYNAQQHSSEEIPRTPPRLDPTIGSSSHIWGGGSSHSESGIWEKL